MTQSLPTIEQLSSYLPHRAPMIWVDEVYAVADSKGSCLVHLKDDALYMDEDGPRKSSAIEWLAQAYGYVCAARAYQQGSNSAASKAFLAQVRNASYKHPLPKSGTLIIEVEDKRILGPLSLITGTVKDFQTKRILVEAELKLFAEQ